MFESKEKLLAQITILEATLKQKDELIAFWKERVSAAVNTQDLAEKRQLEAFEKFTRCMEQIAEFKGYKDAVKLLAKEK